MSAPDDDQAYVCDLAADLLKIGKRGQALATLMPLVERPDASVRALWLAGHIAVIGWNSRVAIPLLERALALAPSVAAIYVDLAVAHTGACRPEAARAVLRRGLTEATDAEPLRALLAVTELGDYRPEAARKQLRLAEAAGKTASFRLTRALLALHDGDWEAARQTSAALLGLDPPPAAPEGATPTAAKPPRYAGAAAAIPFAPPPDIRLATSLSPKGGPAQRDAMTTWRGFATEMISVNTAEEIAVLAPDYPDFRFVETRRNGRDVIGKPLVFIDDILDALAATGAPLLGIVNADIRLLDADRLRADLLAAGAKALTLCHRMDLDGETDAVGPTYFMGFDAFFFPPERVPLFSGSRMLLGAPWWDYLFPALAAHQGLPVRIPDVAVLGHVRHAINWSLASFVATGQIWLEAILALDPAVTPLAARYLAPILAAFRDANGLTGDALANARLDTAMLHQQFTNLATLVNHLVRTQAAGIAAPSGAA